MDLADRVAMADQRTSSVAAQAISNVQASIQAHRLEFDGHPLGVNQIACRREGF